MSSARRLHYTYEQYLQALENSAIKLEYFDGEIFAMAGGTPEHGVLAAKAIALLSVRLPPACRVFSSDVMVQIEATGLSTFPDLSVVCGPLQRAAANRNALVNPRVLVEVTSKGTEEYDRGEKLRQYKLIPSLQSVVFISHRERRVTVHRRGAEGWTEADAVAGGSAEVEPGVGIPVDELYSVVELPG
jgi:Uma2 family endonuclease